MHILTFSSLFPNPSQPLLGLFVKKRMENYVRRFGHEWTVVAPVPWFPRLPFKVNPRYDGLARVPALERPDGHLVHHPRYLVVPGLWMNRHGRWMAAGAKAAVRRIHAARRIDLIDAHYVYPDGAAAVSLGQELGVPVVLSARGTDLNVFPDLPAIRPLIAETAARCRRLICVSASLRDKALGAGFPRDRIDVIGNGVDAERFRPGDAEAARKALGLPSGVPILLTVGNLIELKGHHLVLEALAASSRPDALLALVGQGPLRAGLEEQAKRLGIAGRVRFAGAVPNDALPLWYRAADVLVLASSREGWPNVLCEAQACGLPVVATAVSGIPEIITHPSQGILIGERSPAALRVAMEKALAAEWDRDAIARAGRARTWDAVSEEVDGVFRAALGKA